MNSPDENLVSQTLAGDRDAFGVLVHKYQDMVYTYAFQKVRNEADSQDITQEVFLRAYRHLCKLRHPHRFRSWLYTIMSNECNRWLAQVTETRRHEIALDDATEDALQFEPAHTAATEGWQVDLERAISALPDDNRVAVSMFYMGDCSLKEISEFLGVSVNTARGKLHRARQQLGTAMSEHYSRFMKSRKLQGGFLMQLTEQIRHIPTPTTTFAWSSATVSKTLFSLITALCVLVGLIAGRSDTPTELVTNRIEAASDDSDRWMTPIEVALVATTMSSTNPSIPVVPAQMETRQPAVPNRDSTKQGHRRVERGAVSRNRDVKNAKPELLAVAAERKDEKLTFSGRVVASNGEPVVDAEILYSLDFDPRESVTRTAIDGTFHFESAHPGFTACRVVHIVATHPNHAIGWQNLSPQSTADVEIQLQTPGVISGRAMNEAGVPIQNAVVRTRLSFISNPDWFSVDVIRISPVKTDANGEFVLRGLPQDARANLDIRAPGYAMEERSYVPVGMEGLEFRLKREGRIEGRLTYAGTGASVENATVAIEGVHPPGLENQTSISVDANGNYRLKNLAPGVYNLYLQNGPAEWTAAAKEHIQVVEGQTVTNVDLILVRGGFIAGQLTNRDTNEPITNHNLSIHDAARPESQMERHEWITDESGNYRFRAAPGRAIVYTSAPEGYRDIGEIKKYVDVVEAETVAVDFQFSKGMELVGRILTAAGEPVTGAAWITDISDMDEVQRYGTSDEFGEFTVRGLRAGQKLTVKAEHTELRLRGTVEVDVQFGGSVEIKMEGYEQVMVSGRVTNPNREPIPSAEIELMHWERQSHMGIGTPVATTDIDGRFNEVGLIVDDEYAISAYAEGYRVGETERFTATPKMTEIADLILLPEGGQFFIEGRVTDTSGKPVQGARVSAPDQRQGWETLTDANGDYRLEDMTMAVVIKLSIFHPEYAHHIFRTLKTNQTHDFVLVKADGYLAGRIVDADGSPVELATVSINPREDPRSGIFYLIVRTNAVGEFELRHIKDSIVSISVSTDRSHKVFENIAVNQRDLVLTLTPPKPKPEPTSEQRALWSYNESAEERFKTLVNQPAPELAIAEWLSKSPVTIADLKGKTIVLYFWDLSYVDHYVQRIQLLNILHEEYGAKGLACVGICTAAAKAEVETVKQQIADQSLTYSIGVDRPTTVAGAKGETFHQYAVGWGIPCVLINSAGKVIGRVYDSELEDRIQTLLAD